MQGYNRYAATHPKCGRKITEAELYRFDHVAFNEGIFRAHQGEVVAELGPKIHRPLGDDQYVVRDGRKIPLHGGPGSSGVYNLINMDWRNQEVADGSSFVFTVEYTDEDCPVAYTIMAPARPGLYGAKKWQKGALCR